MVSPRETSASSAPPLVAIAPPIAEGCLPPVFQRAARIDHRHGRTTRQEAAFDACRAPRRYHLPAGTRRQFGKLVTLPERQDEDGAGPWLGVGDRSRSSVFSVRPAPIEGPLLPSSKLWRRRTRLGIGAWNGACPVPRPDEQGERAADRGC